MADKAPRNTKPGIVWHSIEDAAIIAAIKADYKGNGGTLNYKQLEEKYGLRQNNGMSAYNIVTDKTKPKPKEVKEPKPKAEPKAKTPKAPKKPKAEKPAEVSEVITVKNPMEAMAIPVVIETVADAPFAPVENVEVLTVADIAASATFGSELADAPTELE